MGDLSALINTGLNFLSDLHVNQMKELSFVWIHNILQPANSTTINSNQQIYIVFSMWCSRCGKCIGNFSSYNCACFNFIMTTYSISFLIQFYYFVNLYTVKGCGMSTLTVKDGHIINLCMQENIATRGLCFLYSSMSVPFYFGLTLCNKPTPGFWASKHDFIQPNCEWQKKAWPRNVMQASC